MRFSINIVACYYSHIFSFPFCNCFRHVGVFNSILYISHCLFLIIYLLRSRVVSLNSPFSLLILALASFDLLCWISQLWEQYFSFLEYMFSSLLTLFLQCLLLTWVQLIPLCLWTFLKPLVLKLFGNCSIFFSFSTGNSLICCVCWLSLMGMDFLMCFISLYCQLTFNSGLPR